MHGRPAAELSITESLVRALLDDQFPDSRGLPLARVDSGWDNEIFRLGDEFAVRMPRREIGANLILKEQRWLPALTGRLPIPVPAPLYAGRPAADYPWHWSIVPWFEGESADRARVDSDQVEILAGFLRALHGEAPADAPVNPLRGVPLVVQHERTIARMARLEADTDLVSASLRRTWERGLAAPAATERRWLHGDLHAQNVLAGDGIIRAIIDWGDVCAGDVATDLAVAWSLFDDAGDRHRLLSLYAPAQHTLDRAKAWAVFFGLVLVDSGLVNSPRHCAQGRDLLRRLSDDI